MTPWKLFQHEYKTMRVQKAIEMGYMIKKFT